MGKRALVKLREIYVLEKGCVDLEANSFQMLCGRKMSCGKIHFGVSKA